jgi:hypothetical protein
MSLFLITYLIIYGGLHAYFHLKAYRALGFSRLTYVITGIMLAALFVAPIAVRIAEQRGHETVARMLAYIGYGWMALLFSYCVFSCVLEVINLLLRLPVRDRIFSGRTKQLSHRTVFVAACLYACGTYIWGYFEARDILVERVSITSAKLPQGTPPIRIVQLSDVHLGLIIKEDRLARILDIVKRERPDVLVSTGDLVDGRIAPLFPGRTDIPRMALLFHGIEPPLGKFAVTGNHEYYAGLPQALDFTRAAGFTMLRDESVPVGLHLTLAGVDDMAGFQRKEIPRPSDLRALAQADPARLTIFLKHRPRIEKEAAARFDLQLSGHVHKGQIFPFNLIEWPFYPVRCGLTKLVGGSHLYTSRGTGTWGPPVRFLAPPEVTVITVTPG